MRHWVEYLLAHFICHIFSLHLSLDKCAEEIHFSNKHKLIMQNEQYKSSTDETTSDVVTPNTCITK